MTEVFKIFEVDPEEVERLASAENKPHAHTFEELLIGIEGSLEHFIDFERTVVDAPFVSFVTKGKIHQVRPQSKDGKCKIWVIRFQSEFIPETIFQLYSCFHDNANISFPSDRCFNRFVSLCEMMWEEATQMPPDYAILQHLLSTFFVMFEAERRKISDKDTSDTQNDTFLSFLKILEENFRRPVSVDFYAERLFMSSRNLNLICQHIMQQSVSEIIETRKLIEAKNLLVTTDMSVSEIGFELGYKEKSYFSNVFKKKAGQPPSTFRKEMKQLLSLGREQHS